ncbi:2'-5' RNA ligase family protein [Nocardioides antri]|uniref:2'-5' RNA ligase family protein n=1 Tax=Nocardioides antri TaxID=2607659 RepID=UPI001FE400D2|nr:2'-5' RNA ligase family protein [Nocardioides antri]
MSNRRGHSVLVVPVPELEPFVRGRWEHYEPGWVARDPSFTHAHVTALAPYLPQPTAADLDRVAAIADATEPFDYVLREVLAFPNGCLHVPPEPAEPFAALTHALWEAFPQCPPYQGEYDVAPHVTLDHSSATVTVATTRALLAGVLPAACRADRLELHWYEEGSCHVLADWKLGRLLR